MNTSLKLYIAGPLFSMAERAFNRMLADELTNRGHVCILPQVHADQFLPDMRAMVQDCLTQIDDCDVVVACLDGADSDSGTSVETGYAFGKGKPILMFRTDFRSLEVEGVNAMNRFIADSFVRVPSATLDGPDGMILLANALCKGLDDIVASRLQ